MTSIKSIVRAIWWINNGPILLFPYYRVELNVLVSTSARVDAGNIHPCAIYCPLVTGKY